ncbi:VanZ family protein [Salipaludibacillus sp. LMS25]|jgi:VanZ family protein|uniref:VanZ family protein n=1 Tax=Salipaludibacillus sp. LMS25 TaxID=2924031 RepID=UPI0020D13A6C|nr:VanZ family protein [Salipaludibacillus sp. LMS25]UTR16108.1 VanZ family protein [Salipaludibacillus sp. LMS25]
MRERYKFILFYLVPLIGWMGLIYYSSSQTFEEQTVEPVLLDVNLSYIHSYFGWVSFYYGDTLVSLETRSPAEFVEFFIRKGAHVVTFAFLGILSYRLFSYFLKHVTSSSLLAVIFVAMYSTFDEYRQFLNPGRSGMVEDVILNCVGGVLGITLWINITKWVEKKRKQIPTT